MKKAERSNNLLETDNDVTIVGNCANCGVEYHIHTQSHIANLEAQNKELREALEGITHIHKSKSNIPPHLVHWESAAFGMYMKAEQALKKDKQDGN